MFRFPVAFQHAGLPPEKPFNSRLPLTLSDPRAKLNFNPLKGPTEAHPTLIRNAQPRSRQLNGGLADQSANMLASWPASMIAARVHCRLGADAAGVSASGKCAALSCQPVSRGVGWLLASPAKQQRGVTVVRLRSRRVRRSAARKAARGVDCSTGDTTDRNRGGLANMPA